MTIVSFFSQYEWFFNENSFDSIPGEINPQMPRLPPVQSHGTPETFFNNETKPGEIIEHIVRAARRRWSSPILIDTLSSSPPSNDQQTSKSINISVKRYFDFFVNIQLVKIVSVLFVRIEK